jgi:hypothetical protein
MRVIFLIVVLWLLAVGVVHYCAFIVRPWIFAQRGPGIVPGVLQARFLSRALIFDGLQRSLLMRCGGPNSQRRRVLGLIGVVFGCRRRFVL